MIKVFAARCTKGLFTSLAVMVITVSLFFTACISMRTITGKHYGDFRFDETNGTITDYYGSGGALVIPPYINGTAVTVIGQQAFAGRMRNYQFPGVGLTSVVIPESVRTIEANAFAGNPLIAVYLPDSVTVIAPDAFNSDVEIVNSSTNRERVAMMAAAGFIPVPTQALSPSPAAQTNTQSGSAAPALAPPAEIPENPESDFEVIITNDGKGVLIERYVGESENVRIPQVIQGLPVLEIGSICFYDSYAVNIIIPEGVTTIHGPERYQGLLASAFSGAYGSSSVVSITLPESLTRISAEAFLGAYALRSIVIPDSIKVLPAGMFRGCRSLESVTLPEGLTTIGRNAFEGCYALASFTIPETVTRIEGGAFARSGLVSITWSARLPMIENNPYAGTTGMFENCENLNTVILPEGVEAIADNAFMGCTALTSVTLPSTIRSIRPRAFRDCSAITTFTVPDTVTAITFSGSNTEREGRNGAFSGCGDIPLGIQALLRRLGYNDEF